MMRPPLFVRTRERLALLALRTRATPNHLTSRLWQSMQEAVAGLATSQTAVLTRVRQGGRPKWYRGESTANISAKATMIDIIARTE